MTKSKKKGEHPHADQMSARNKISPPLPPVEPVTATGVGTSKALRTPIVTAAAAISNVSPDYTDNVLEWLYGPESDVFGETPWGGTAPWQEYLRCFKFRTHLAPLQFEDICGQELEIKELETATAILTQQRRFAIAEIKLMIHQALGKDEATLAMKTFMTNMQNSQWFDANVLLVHARTGEPADSSYTQYLTNNSIINNNAIGKALRKNEAEEFALHWWYGDYAP